MAPLNPATKPDPVIIAVEPFGGSIRSHMPQLPLVYWDDAAVTRGDGVFETLLIHEGKACNFDRHMQRFIRSAEALDLPAPDAEVWRKATDLALEEWEARSEADAKCVWTYTRGRESTKIPSMWLTVTPVAEKVLQQREEGVRVMTTSRGYTLAEDSAEVPPWLIRGAKTLNYANNMAALRWARSHGFDDVIFLDGDRVLEGATSTVVSVKGDKLRTPTPGGDILAGTTQAALFEYAEQQGWRCKAKDLSLDDLLRADSVWLVSSVRVAARVRRLDDAKLPRPDNEAEVKALIEAALHQS